MFLLPYFNDNNARGMYDFTDRAPIMCGIRLYSHLCGIIDHFYKETRHGINFCFVPFYRICMLIVLKYNGRLLF